MSPIKKSPRVQVTKAPNAGVDGGLLLGEGQMEGLKVLTADAGFVGMEFKHGFAKQGEGGGGATGKLGSTASHVFQMAQS